LIGAAKAANVETVATLTSNPLNIFVVSFSWISYRGFLASEAPIALVGLACVFVVVALVYRRQLPDTPLEIVPDTRLAVHYPLMWKTLAAASVMLLAFLGGVPIAIVAVTGGACTLFSRRVNPAKVSREFNWGLLVVFPGLFVVTAGREHSRVVALLLRGAAAAIRRH